MKVILSPAKSINEEIDCSQANVTQHRFQEESQKLVGKLKKLSAPQIKQLMKVSDQIADLNHQRFQDWSLPFNEANAFPVAFIFTGAAYQTLDYPSLSQKEQEVGQHKLRILSGLYGLLRPLDLIQSYRLEMGTRFQSSPKTTNLYQFWGDKILNELQDELTRDGDQVLVNAASNEYSKAAILKKIKTPVITTVFKDKGKDGNYKVNMQFAKQARGSIARFIIQNDLKKIDDLKAFDTNGYFFSPADSSEEQFVFLRDKK